VHFIVLEGTFFCGCFLIHHFLGHCRLCKEQLKQQDGNIKVDKWLAKGFANWLQNHVRSPALVQLCVLTFVYFSIVCLAKGFSICVC
jgi:hypothetical protein